MTVHTSEPKGVDYYLGLPYSFLVYRDQRQEGEYWVADVRELPYCTGTGDTPQEALACAQESLRYWLEAAIDHGTTIPEPPALAAHQAMGG